jgi:ribonuclease P protein component
VQRRAKKHLTADLVVLWMPGRRPNTRLGITVSRKVAKQATRRNRIKRWIRESFRQLDLELAPRPLDVVVIARARATQATQQQIAEQLMAFWLRVATGPPPAAPGG